MFFNSLHFLVFYAIVFVLYFKCPMRWRWFLMLTASYYFYGCWNPVYLLLILLTTAVDWWVALKIDESNVSRTKKWYLALSLASNLGVLFYFKYTNFFIDVVARNAGKLFGFSVPSLNILLPLGISFYTFQSLSYLFEVYRGNAKAERHMGLFALYVHFFPQLVAGPIERPQHLLPQFRVEHTFDYERAVCGLRLMLWGLFKKVVIADRLALIVDGAYGAPKFEPGLTLLIATYAYAFQIYCDFSGYSDIAIGCAQALGYDLMENFRRPYFAESVAEFWRRWHISLSTWFRDYLFLPLFKGRVSKARMAANIMLVFTISGLWHGAGMTFVIWGALHGLYLVCSNLTETVRSRAVQAMHINRASFGWKLFRILTTFHLVCIGWIFFRAGSIRDVRYILYNLFANAELPWSSIKQDPNELGLAAALIALLLAVELLQRKGALRTRVTLLPGWLRWAGYAAIALAIINLGMFKELPFIYFQF